MSLTALGCLAMMGATLDEPWATRTDHRSVEVAALPCATNVQTVATGMVIDDRTVVTVAHPIWQVADLAVRDAFGRWHRPQLVHIDPERDLALLTVPRLRATPAETAPTRPVADWPGQTVRLLHGATSGDQSGEILRRVRLTIEVVGDRQRDHARLGYEVSLATEAGDSGAAIVEPDGALVGVVFARSRDGSGRAWATAFDEIIDLVADPPGPVGTGCNTPFGTDLVLR